MISFEELNHQNDKITELSNVLSYLIDDRSICDTSVTCELFFEYVDRVRQHLDVEERELYQGLLAHKDNKVCNTAKMFLSGSGEIKRVFSQYLKRWCKSKELRIKDHDQFVKETREMFALMLRRIEDEVEHLYPTVREVNAGWV
jgi:hemerythrin-like domain-containing protein